LICCKINDLINEDQLQSMHKNAIIKQIDLQVAIKIHNELISKFGWEEVLKFIKKQNKDKKQTLAQYGEAQFMLWRRSFDVPPPPIDPTDKYSQANDPRYLGITELPNTECLKDVIVRMLPYWEQVVIPQLQAGELVMITAHGNSLRALVKELDGISDTDIAELNIPTGIPLFYELDKNFKPIKSGGTYLDPAAAAAAAAKVADQGR
jgi:2,3-bisphosphoglycerate-dependent phosphoglycerate mutase